MSKQQQQQQPLEATPPVEQEPEKETKQDPKVLVRVLQACRYGQANDVVEIPEKEVDSAKRDGLIDAHKEAVAYAQSLIKG